MIQAAAIFKWLELIGRPAEHSDGVCGDGGELLFFNADEFTPEEVSAPSPSTGRCRWCV